MGIFGKLFSKKRFASSDELEVVQATNSGCLGEAEQIANVVTAGLEKENYSGMNRQLATITQQEENKEIYIFEHPRVNWKFFAIAICAFISAAFVYFLYIGVSTAYMSDELFSVGMFIAGTSGIVLFINVTLISRYISSIRYKSRFDLYDELMGYRRLEFVEDLALCSRKKESVVIKDLQRATKLKLIPQGHFSKDNLVFMVSNDVYDRYMEKPAVYDRYFQKKLEERRRIKSRTRRISQIMESGNQYIEKIRGFGMLVKDKSVSKKIARMENVVSMIFHEIDVNPEQAQSLGVFLNYYLPTTERLLDAYVTIGEKQASDKNSAKAKKEIEEAFNTIITAFEGILEKLYEDQEMDIASDIAAMELSMKQEGLPT